MGQEIAFEVLEFAQQAAFGTGETQPTHYVPLDGMIKVEEQVRQAKQSTGTVAANWRSTRTDLRGAFAGKGDYEHNVMPLFLMSLINGATPVFTTPVDATNGRLVTIKRAMTSLSQKALTTFFGDPNVRTQQAIDTFLLEMKLSAKAADESGVLEIDLSGFSKHISTKAGLVSPTQVLGTTFAAAHQQVWLQAYGDADVEITETITDSGITIPSGLKPKKTASGPGSALTWTRRGIEATNPEAYFEVELDDYSIYDLWEARELMTLRQRYNGAYIEDVAAVPTYEYVEFIMHGYLMNPEAGENAGTNRTHKYSLAGKYDVTAATDLTVNIYTTSTTV